MSALPQHNVGAAAETRFAANVAAVRRARKMSQDQLAAAVGVGRSAIVSVEGGGRRVRLGEAVDIATALGVSLDALLGDQPISISVTV